MKKKLYYLALTMMLICVNVLTMLPPKVAAADASCLESGNDYPEGYIVQWTYCNKCHQAGGPSQMATTCAVTGGMGCHSSTCLDRPST